MRYVWYVVLFATAAGACTDATPLTKPRAALLRAGGTLQYSVVKLNTLGGPGTSQGGGINNQGWVAGFSGLPDGTRHAALWRNGTLTELGALGGPSANSNAQWPGLNNGGTVVGISQTATPDPLVEGWSCSAFIPATGNTCVGFVWQAGLMTPLATLGGNNGFAAGVNAVGQVVGWAETRVHDPTCSAPQVLQFRAAVWGPAPGAVRELPPLPGDSTSAATAINDRGQVVGISGACDVAVGRGSATHAVMWDHGAITDLGNLGGQLWHTPMAINQTGEVVGFSNPPNGDVQADSLHAFLWTRAAGIQDLGRLPGDGLSEALGINARGQVVGVSCGAFCRAFLWQDGVMMDLNQLVGPGFPDLLWSARDINDSGQITGRLIDLSTGRALPFIATPIGAATVVSSSTP